MEVGEQYPVGNLEESMPLSCTFVSLILSSHFISLVLELNTCIRCVGWTDGVHISSGDFLRGGIHGDGGTDEKQRMSCLGEVLMLQQFTRAGFMFVAIAGAALLR